MTHPKEIDQNGYYWIVFHGTIKPEPAGYYGRCWFTLGSRGKADESKFLVVKECNFDI